jgi:predicted amidophosphoribosyltransferase
VYEGEVARLINRIKSGERRLCFFFGERMAEYFVRDIRVWEEAGVYGFKPEETIIAYTPVDPKRRNARGFNQAEELAVAFAERLAEEGYCVPVAKELITLNKALLQQKELRIHERAKNVRGAFHVSRRKEVKGKVVLLVDDIMTTGATGDECAQILLRAGAKAVLFCISASKEEEEKRIAPAEKRR